MSTTLFGTSSRTWTGKAFLPRDFKSLVFTNFTTEALIGAEGWNRTNSTFVSDLQSDATLLLRRFRITIGGP